MVKPKVRLRQIYKANKSNTYVEIIGTKGGRYQSRVLTDRPGVYKGTHTLSLRTIAKCYTLQEK